MKKITLLFSLFVSLNYCYSQNELKLAYINLSELIMTMPEINIAIEEVELFTARFENTLIEMQNDFERKYNDYVENSDKLYQTEKQEKEFELKEIQKEIQQFQQNAQKEIAQKEEELLEPIKEKAKMTLKSIGERYNYSVIIDNSRGMFLAFSSDCEDITNLVKKELGIENSNNSGSSTKGSVIPKIGSLDSKVLLEELHEFKNAKNSLEDYVTELREEMEALQSEFRVSYTEYLEKSDLYSEMEKQNKETELQNQQVKIQEFQQKGQQDIQLKEVELLKPIMDNFNGNINEIASENNFTFIVDNRERDFFNLNNSSYNLIEVIKNKMNFQNNNASIDSEPKQNLPIGFIDTEKFLHLMQDYEIAQDELNQYRTEIESSLTQMQENYEEKYNDYIRNVNSYSSQSKKELEEEIQEIYIQMQKYSEQITQDYTVKEKELFEPIFEIQNQWVNTFCEGNNIGFVFDISRDNVLYFDKDFTYLNDYYNSDNSSIDQDFNISDLNKSDTQLGDTEIPTIKIIEPKVDEGSWLKVNTDKTLIKVEVTDNNEIFQVMINKIIATEVARGIYQIYVDLEYGINTIKIYTVDMDGNSATKNFEIERSYKMY